MSRNIFFQSVSLFVKRRERGQRLRTGRVSVLVPPDIRSADVKKSPSSAPSPHKEREALKESVFATSHFSVIAREWTTAKCRGNSLLRKSAVLQSPTFA